MSPYVPTPPLVTLAPMIREHSDKVSNASPESSWVTTNLIETIDGSEGQRFDPGSWARQQVFLVLSQQHSFAAEYDVSIFGHLLQFKCPALASMKGYRQWLESAPKEHWFKWMEPMNSADLPPGIECGCKGDNVKLCGEDSSCYNRNTETYCIHHACKTQMPNDCPNILIHKFGPKGWGLKSTRKLPRGTFVCEYLGAIIERDNLRKQGENNYILRLWQRFIDAKRQCNQARFLNHSCNPNCELLKKDHGGRPCIVIITKGEIPLNTELTSSHGWDSAVECLGCRMIAEQSR